MLLSNLLDRLAGFEPTGLPVISLYLNMRPDERGRDHFEPFVRKEFKERAKTFAQHSAERESFDRDAERINQYLEQNVRASANGLAIFACAGANDFFEAVQLDAPVERHRLAVSNRPDLYPLARLIDQYPRYAALLVNTNSARLFVFGLGTGLGKEEVVNPKTKRTMVGGWSQTRFQRHVENYHLHHAKEVIEVLDRVVSEEHIQHIIIAGDEVIVPTLRDQLPPHLADKVVDVLSLDIKTPEHEVMQATLDSMRERDAKDDREKVGRMLDEYRAGGLAVAGVRNTLSALELGQVDELILSASRATIRDDGEEAEGVTAAPLAASASAGARGSESRAVALADELIAKAKQTGARVTFIEDAELLASVGGVGGMLRFRL
jgi:peptide chain release factor subunit 1